jgi:hypothetical protein
MNFCGGGISGSAGSSYDLSKRAISHAFSAKEAQQVLPAGLLCFYFTPKKKAKMKL